MQCIPCHRLHSHPRCHTHRREKRRTMGEMHPKNDNMRCVRQRGLGSKLYHYTNKKRDPRNFFMRSVGIPVLTCPSHAGVCATPVASYIFQGHGGQSALSCSGFALCASALVCCLLHVNRCKHRSVMWNVEESDGFLFAAEDDILVE